MVEGATRGDAAARGLLEERLLDEVRLVNVLDGVLGLADGDGDGLEAEGSAAVTDKRAEDPSVHGIETDLVDAEHAEAFLGKLDGDAIACANLGEVADASEVPVGLARGSAGATCDDLGCGIVHVDFGTLKRTIKDSALWYGKVIATNGRALHAKR